MHKSFSKFFVWFILACLPFTLAGCYGGNGATTEVSQPDNATTVSGFAMKGLISGAFVGLYQLKNDGKAGDLLGSTTSGSDGAYSITVPKSSVTGSLLVVVRGQDGAAESFSAMFDAADAASGVAITPLTEVAYQTLLRLLAGNPAATATPNVVKAINNQVAAYFGVVNILATPSVAYLEKFKEIYATFGSGSTLTAMSALNDELKQNLPPADFSNVIPPTVSANLKVTAVAVTSTQSDVVLTWDASTIATGGNNAVVGYDVYRDGNKIATVTTTGYSDKNVTSGITYSYTVVAFDAAGNRSVASGAASVKPLSPNLTITVDGQVVVPPASN